MKRRARIPLPPPVAVPFALVRPIAFACAGFAVLLHLAVANRYGFFRDELYFIVCGKHPAFGYVDQPPLVPLIAAATQAFGHDLILLRAVAALAAGGTVLFVCALARLAGGGRFAVALAGIAVATAPLEVGLHGLLSTSVFEPLTWAALAYFLAVAAIDRRHGALIWAGVATGLALEAKYEIVFYALPLAIALLLTPERALLRTREFWLGVACAVALASPSIAWQAAHGFPMLEVLRAGSAGKNVVLGPAAFVVEQVVNMNVFFAPVWLAGVAGSLTIPWLRRVRFLGIGFALTFVVTFALHAKVYYIAGLYGSAFALGGVVVERAIRNAAARAAYVALGVAAAALVWPVAIPLLDPPQLVAYSNALHLAPHVDENSEKGQAIQQNLADQIGWPEMVAEVARVYGALPPSERAGTALLASNYGEAGAIDFYGGAYGLPHAISGHNQYYAWGPRGYTGSTIIRINPFDLSFWRKNCRSAVVAGTFGHSPYVEPYEHDRPIVLCRGFYKPLAAAWPDFKDFE